MTPIFRNFREASRSRIDQYGFDRYLFFGQADELTDGPQAYMNELDPGVELAAHFHKVDQFQVFFGVAGARFLRHPIPEVMVHYTDAYSTYGPFSSGSEGRLLYATLRAEHSNYGGVMPGARQELRYKGDRNLESDVDRWNTANAPATGASHRQVIPEGNDGMGCTLTVVGPCTEFAVPRRTETAGRYYCVLDGALEVGSVTYSRLALGWQDGDEEPATLLSGPAGSGLLTLDFPFPSSPVQRGVSEAI